ncbi:MAG: polysaccharide deacetylase family protein [Clostridia bacterium]|nr:polysaccharide deacetylase family protein [Clostridia bacterium]
MINEKFFVRGVCSLIIIALVLCVYMVCFSSSEIQAVLSADTLKPYYKGNTSQKQVSLMINVYWGEDYIEGMLNVLDEYNTKATFFFGGMWVEKNPLLLKKIFDRGHEIANHGYFHKNGDRLDFDGNRTEIYACQQMIFNTIGVKTTLFAPPSGAFCKATLEAANSLGYKTVMWSKDTIDWRDSSSDLVFRRATVNLANGDLVLMHPTAHTLEALPRILKVYAEKDFKTVTVSVNIEAF